MVFKTLKVFSGERVTTRACCCLFVRDTSVIGKAGNESIDRFVFNQCCPPQRSVPVTRRCVLLIWNGDARCADFALLPVGVWRHVSGPCSFQLSESPDGSSTERAATHTDEQEEVTTGGKASDWIKNNNDSIQPIALRSRNRLRHICYLWDDASFFAPLLFAHGLLKLLFAPLDFY